MVIQCDELQRGVGGVISPSLEWKSISWTKRGFQNAALEVIYIAWEFHTHATGLESPFDIKELALRFADENGIAA